MKKLLAGLILFLATGAGSLFAMGSFEGVVDYQMSFENGKQMNLEYTIKGKKFRSDMDHDGNQMSTIMDMGSKKMITLMHKQKMYMTHSIASTLNEASKHTVKGKFHKTTGSKSILGYSCDHWVYEGEAGKSDIWLASGLGTFTGFASGNQGSQSGFDWLKGIKDKGLFAMEVDSTGKNGKTMTMVATKLEKKSISESLFEVPAGYKKMPGMEDMGGAGKMPSHEDMLKGMKPKLPF